MISNIFKFHPVSTKSISFQYIMLSRIYLKHQRPNLIQKLVSRGILYSRKRIKRYKRLALSALLTKKIIFQQFYYLFLSRLFKWLRMKIIFSQVEGCECFSLKLIKLFYFYSVRRVNKRIYDFLGGIPNTILPRSYKYLIFSRARRYLKPISSKFYKYKTVYGLGFKNFGSTYIDDSYSYPTSAWIVNFFKKKRNRYKLSWLHLFSGYRGRRLFQHRKYRRKRRNTHVKVLSKYKDGMLRNNSMLSSEVRAETYLKYFYDYSIYDLHKISYRFFKIYSFCNLGSVFYFPNKRLDFLVRRKFCNFRMYLIREILKKGLVCVNGIIIKDPSYIVRTGQLISFKLIVNNLYSVDIIGIFLSMYSIRNNILRTVLKSKLYKILLTYFRDRQIQLKVPFFRKRIGINSKYDQKFLNRKKNYLAKIRAKIRAKRIKRLKLLQKRRLRGKGKERTWKGKSEFKPLLASANKPRRHISKLLNIRPGSTHQKRHYSSNRYYANANASSRKFKSFERQRHRNPHSTYVLGKMNKRNKSRNRNNFYPRSRIKRRFKKSVVHYKDKLSCDRSFFCERRTPILVNKRWGRRASVKQFNTSKYTAPKAKSMIKKFKRYTTESLSSKLHSDYDVLNWEKEYVHRRNINTIKRNKQILLIKYLKQTKLNVLYAFSSMCRKQRFFLHNLNIYVNLVIDHSEHSGLLKCLLYSHKKYRGIVKKNLRFYRVGSLCTKLFIKSLKNNNNYFFSLTTKKNELYNMIINGTPTKFHKLLKISNYLLLLRYRVVMSPSYENGTFLNFECLRITPLNYVKRGNLLLYENRPGSSRIILRDHWFKLNKYYLPR